MTHASPELDALLMGYRRFRANGWEQQRERWASLCEGQHPRVMIIACSDSRVDPSQIFDVGPGEIFVVRNVAALVPPYETTAGLHGVSAALEFAVDVLEISEIMVMGHGMCGGCKASLTKSMDGKEPGHGAFIANWMAMLDEVREPIVAKFGTTGREAEREMEYAGVRVSLANLRTFPFVAEREQRGDLQLRGAFFAVSDGLLHLMDKATEEFAPVSLTPAL